MTIAVYWTQHLSGYPKAETSLSGRVRLTKRWASRALSTPAGGQVRSGKMFDFGGWDQVVSP